MIRSILYSCVCLAPHSGRRLKWRRRSTIMKDTGLTHGSFYKLSGAFYDPFLRDNPSAIDRTPHSLGHDLARPSFLCEPFVDAGSAVCELCI
jgi:hypothetical protein